MTRVSSPPAPSLDDVRSRVDALLPEIRARAAETERACTVPAELATSLEDAGVFRLQRVRDLGGLEADPATILDLIERLAHADASTAWAALIGMTASSFFARLDPAVAADLLAPRPGAGASCVFAPSGSAVPDGEGFRVTGRWEWNSGVKHTPWHQVGAVVPGTEGPEVRVVFLADDEVGVVDHWDTMGLRGTGSHDLQVQEVWVPAQRTFVAASARCDHEGPYARFGIGDLVNVGVVAFPLGVARRAVDEFVERARAKTRGVQSRWSVAEDSEVQADVGRAESALAAARAFADAAAAELWTSVLAGAPDPRAQGRLAMATAHALRTAVDVVDVCYRHGGASAMRLDDPLQRCFRDLHAVAGHVFYSAEADRGIGRRRLTPE
ncbi:acyl-CoA dehydrogenase family protein [Actinomycetospora termitidis]|uniref:Acyl-CoA dehydrogenase family protein n=1 Tax=Actinomycetospora termitidis TaxID=3053470 RepID=A0ABT7M5P0_9PSEU|nr:acyl-CoA dehydrogenase family protein [Actinomycetospora sp. Odt1-22]MDL5155868.1 acyl-CoA dehydrogenase family protein [Actinomycetospora sp. Odt1-22]